MVDKSVYQISTITINIYFEQTFKPNNTYIACTRWQRRRDHNPCLHEMTVMINGGPLSLRMVCTSLNNYNHRGSKNGGDDSDEIVVHTSMNTLTIYVTPLYVCMQYARKKRMHCEQLGTQVVLFIVKFFKSMLK